MAVGTNLKKILKDKKMTIKELSKLSGVKLGTLYDITKRDSFNVRPETLEKIAKTLNIEVADLFLDESVINRANAHFDLMEESEVFIKVYKEALNDKGKRKVHEYTNDLRKVDEYLNKGYEPLKDDEGK